MNHFEATVSQKLSQKQGRADALGFRAAMIASAGAGAIHLAAAHAHLIEWPAAGVFMIVSGLAQLGWIAWAATATTSAARRAAAAVALAGNGGLVLLWALSRTTGLPFGPDAWTAEPPHSPDLVATGLELLIVLAVAGMLLSRAPRPVRRLVVLSLAGLALSVAVTSDEPAVERSVAFATLALTGAATAVFSALVKAPAPARAVRRVTSTGRNHVDPSAPPRIATPNTEGQPARREPFVRDARSGIAILARG